MTEEEWQLRQRLERLESVITVVLGVWTEYEKGGGSRRWLEINLQAARHRLQQALDEAPARASAEPVEGR